MKPQFLRYVSKTACTASKQHSQKECFKPSTPRWKSQLRFLHRHPKTQVKTKMNYKMKCSTSKCCDEGSCGVGARTLVTNRYSSKQSPLAATSTAAEEEKSHPRRKEQTCCKRTSKEGKEATTEGAKATLKSE
jgi:hypothetical protein